MISIRGSDDLNPLQIPAAKRQTLAKRRTDGKMASSQSAQSRTVTQARSRLHPNAEADRSLEVPNALKSQKKYENREGLKRFEASYLTAKRQPC
jgi:hypothetical protein